MRIPTYGQKEIPEGAQEQVFRSGALKATPRQVPVLDQAAKGQQKFGKIAFDIANRIDLAENATAVAEAQKKAYEDYSAMQDRFKDPKTLDKNSPNYISPEELDSVYQRESRSIRDNILKNFKGRNSNKQKLGLYLDDYHNRELVKTNSLSRGRKIDDMTRKFYTRIDDNLEAASVAYNKGDTDAIGRLLINSESDISAAVHSGLITPGEGRRVLSSVQSKANNGIQNADINTAYNLALETKNVAPLQKLLDDRYSKPDKDDVMTEQERIRFKIKVESRIRSVKRETKTTNYLERAKLEDAMDDAIVTMAKNGKAEVRSTFDKIDAAYGDEPDKAAAIKYKFDQALLKAGAVHYGVNVVQETSLRDMTEEGWFDNQSGNLRPEIHADVKIAMQREAIRKAKALHTDPLNYLKEIDSVKKMTAEYDASMADDLKPETEKAKIHAEYLENVRQLQLEQGVVESNVRMMTNSDAAAISVKLMEATPLDKVQTIMSMEKAYGKHWDTAFNDLSREELPEGMKIVAALNGDGAQPQIRMNMAEAMSLKDSEFSKAMGVEAKDIRVDVNTSINDNEDMIAFQESVMSQGATDDNIRRVGEIKDAVRKLSYVYIMKDGDTSNANDMADKAVSDVIGKLYDFGGDDATYRVPKEFDVSLVEQYTSAIQNRITEDSLSPRLDQSPARIAELRQNGYWVNNEATDGLFLVYNGLVVFGADNKPIEYKFGQEVEDINLPTLPGDEFLEPGKIKKGESRPKDKYGGYGAYIQ